MENISCPCCNADDHVAWAEEAGFSVVRCKKCRFLYVNPRPSLDYIDSAVTSGEHSFAEKITDVRSRRVPSKVKYYQDRLRPILADVISANKPVRWLDVGCGYGELMEALGAILPEGSEIKGVEPMEHKAEAARSRNLNVYQGYLQNSQFEMDFISNIDVFSHIPDYHSFLKIIVSNLSNNGEFVMETGNLADLERVEEAPNELGLPDHLVFGGKDNFHMYFDKAKLELVSCKEYPFDTIVQTAKNFAKIILGRPSRITIPYSSKYRQLIMRARKIKC